MKYCAYNDCANVIPEDHVFCVSCRIHKSIIGLSDQNTEAEKQGYKNWIGWMLVMRGINIRPDWEGAKGSVPVAVSQGRWYAKCPNPECRGNMPLNELEPKTFCIDCLNVKNDFKAFRVDWKHFKTIKHIMAARIDKKRRNYLPHAGETLASLEQENKQHGWSLDNGL